MKTVYVMVKLDFADTLSDEEVAEAIREMDYSFEHIGIVDTEIIEAVRKHDLPPIIGGDSDE